MDYRVYERTGTTHDILLCTAMTKKMAQIVINTLENMDVQKGKYEPMRYYIEEVSDGTRTMQEL